MRTRTNPIVVTFLARNRANSIYAQAVLANNHVPFSYEYIYMPLRDRVEMHRFMVRVWVDDWHTVVAQALEDARK